MNAVEFSKRVGIFFGTVIAAGTVLGWLYSHTAGPIVREVRDNTRVQAAIVTRLEAMERRQDRIELEIRERLGEGR